MPVASIRVDFGSEHFPNRQMMWDRKQKTSKTRPAADGGALAVTLIRLCKHQMTDYKTNRQTL